MKKVFYFHSPRDHKLVLDSLYSPALPLCDSIVIGSDGEVQVIDCQYNFLYFLFILQ